jgi:hypothetical protein
MPMSRRIAGMRLAVYMCAMLLLVCARPGSADELSTSSDDARRPSACQRTTAGVEEVTPSEPSGVGAGIVLDEHLLTNGSRDQDYNGGGEFTFSGEHIPVGTQSNAFLKIERNCSVRAPARQASFRGSPP